MIHRYKKGTFITIPNRDQLRDLDGYSQLVFMWLCSYADENGQCFPSLRTLAKDTGTTSQNVINKLKILEKKGLITKTTQKKKGTKENEVNLYQILLVESSKEPPQEPSGGGKPDLLGVVNHIDHVVNQVDSNSTHITKPKITTNVVTASQQGPQPKPVSYGNPEINELLEYLKSKLGSEKLDGTIKQNRRYAKLCLSKFGPDPPDTATALESTKKIINLAFRDPFHASRSTEIKYIYYNGMKIVATARANLNKQQQRVKGRGLA